MSALSEPLIGICAVRERTRWSFWDQPAHLGRGVHVINVALGGTLIQDLVDGDGSHRALHDAAISHAFVN